MSDQIVRLPGRIVFGRAHFDDGRPPVYCADVMFLSPWETNTIGALGLRLTFTGSPPWLAGQTLPGISFGSAVANSLPMSVVDQVLRGEGGRAFTDLEVADLLSPVLAMVAQGKIILAGVQTPVSPDPVYVRFSPIMLPHWRFVPGEDLAEPLMTGALAYHALRIFKLEEFALVEAHGGRLRPTPPAAGVERNQYRSGGSGRPSSVHLARNEMRCRHAKGQMRETLYAECVALVKWLNDAHQYAPPIKPKSLSEQLRTEYRTLSQKP